MPLLDHFHPPLHGPRRWEGFHHSWATFIAQQLNAGILPQDYYAEAEISIGPELEVDIAAMEQPTSSSDEHSVATEVWAPPIAKMAVQVDFARFESYEIRVYRDLGGADLRAAIELISPANKDRVGNRETFAAKCAGYLRQGIGLVIVDVVTSRLANLHEGLLATMEVKHAPTWQSSTDLYAVAYRPVTLRKSPRVEIWPEDLALGKPLPELPLWLAVDLCVPLRLEESYVETCRSLRIAVE